MAAQEWDQVVFRKAGRQTPPNQTKKEHLSAAKRKGGVSARLKMGKSNNAAVSMSDRVGGEQNMCKFEQGGEETFRHAKVGNELRAAIAQARVAKGLTQKQLAAALNVRLGMVADYESGKAIPNTQFIVRLEKKLGCKLPRGQRSATTVKKPATGSGSVAAKKKKKKKIAVDLMKGLRISK